MAFFRSLLDSLLYDDPQLHPRFVAVHAPERIHEVDNEEIPTIPFLLHILARDDKRTQLMSARVPGNRENHTQDEAEGDSILHYAARRGYTFWCDALLRRDALLDERNASQGFTPLFVLVPIPFILVIHY
jgi:hypothetical protein